MKFILGWPKWCTRDTMWARIRRKIIRDAGNISTDILHCIVPFHYCCIHSLVVFRIYSYTVTSGSSNIKGSIAVFEISRTWIICIWTSAKYFAFSSDAISRFTPVHVLIFCANRSCRDNLCFGSLDFFRYRGSSIGCFNFVMDFSYCPRNVRSLCKEVCAHLEWIVTGVIQFHCHQLEASFTLCSHGVVSSNGLT